MKHFDEEVRRLHKNDWHTYPKTPKMNAHVERFNRTIQEEFIDYHQDLLLDPDQFNRQLIPWLIWYNAERPHWALKLDSPVQFLLKTKSRSVQFMVAQYTRFTLTPRPDRMTPPMIQLATGSSASQEPFSAPSVLGRPSLSADNELSVGYPPRSSDKIAHVHCQGVGKQYLAYRQTVRIPFAPPFYTV